VRTDSTLAQGLVQRYDTLGYQALEAPQMRPDGSTVYDCYVSCPGILVYQDEQGRAHRELVLPETLADAESLATLARATVTLEHPATFVTPDTWGQVSVGDVDSSVQALPSGYVRAQIAVRTRAALNAIRQGVQEISAGYLASVDYTAGVHPVYGAYDAIQRRRVYNHVALVPQGRAGHTVRLRADGAAHIIHTTHDGGTSPADPPTQETAMAIAAEDMEKIVDKMQSMIKDAFKAYKADMEEEIKKKKEQDMAAEEEAKKKAQESKKDAAPTPEQLHALAIERAELIGLAKTHGVEIKADMTNASLRKAVVLKAKTDARQDADEAYYKAAIDFLPTPATSQHASAYQEIGQRMMQPPAPVAKADARQLSPRERALSGLARKS
jgi:hypothetical protein